MDRRAARIYEFWITVAIIAVLAGVLLNRLGSSQVQVEAAAMQLGAQLKRSAAFRNVIAELPPFDASQITRFYAPYRFGLLSMADRAALPAGAILRLVVIDGTWRKSRKMLYLNPALQQLPRLSLQAVTPGRYAIRKAQAPGQLSSFEAAALALGQLQGWDAASPSAQRLMQSFDATMQQHQALQNARTPGTQRG